MKGLINSKNDENEVIESELEDVPDLVGILRNAAKKFKDQGKLSW